MVGRARGTPVMAEQARGTQVTAAILPLASPAPIMVTGDGPFNSAVKQIKGDLPPPSIEVRLAKISQSQILIPLVILGKASIKNPAYGRHRISRSMRIVASILFSPRRPKRSW